MKPATRGATCSVRAALLAAAGLLAACAAPATDTAPADPDAQALREADLAFAADVAQRGLPAWLDWFCPDAVKLAVDAEPVRGRAAIAAADGPLFEDPTRLLAWAPDQSGWLEPGRRGYTLGSWRYVERDAGPDERPLARGRYLSVWVLTPEGWRCELDLGIPER